jgi:hypothetical protein
MGKDKHKGPYFLLPILYFPEEEKEAYPSDGKPPSVKLLLDSQGKKIDNPTVLLNYSHSRNPRCAPARTHGQIQAPREPPN